jgi:hypothetical protein|tara:strand:+ start:1944 stop:2330 length:387 start_codon:yes stop_codon:yes gene_type:complete
MTQFDKTKFTYHGGYLMYNGTYEGQPTYDEVYGKDKIHPSRIGMPVELFIARFKYVFFQGSFKNFLVKNFTVEEYATRYKNGESPLTMLEEKGFMTPQAKKLCKQNGMKPTQENYKICIHAMSERMVA